MEAAVFEVDLQGSGAGTAEGNGSVRTLGDPVWSYPSVDEVLRVTVTPMN